MMSIRKITRFLLASAFVVVGFVGTSEASTITVLPNSQTIAPGGTASVDIVLSGLTANETVGAFSLQMSFNPAILGGLTDLNNPDSVMGPSPLDLSFGFAGGSGSPLDIFYSADQFITQPALHALEGSGFRLATVTFTGLATGVSPLTLTIVPNGAFLFGFDGVTPLATPTLVNGSVCVATPGAAAPNCTAAAVPEPATLTLLGGGLAALVSRRRRKAAAKA